MSKENEQVIKLELDKETLKAAFKEAIKEAMEEMKKDNQTVTTRVANSPLNSAKSGLMHNMRRLLQNGFFDTGRDLNDVRKELEKQGLYFEPSTLAPVLLYLIRIQILRREGTRGSFKYMKVG